MHQFITILVGWILLQAHGIISRSEYKYRDKSNAAYKFVYIEADTFPTSENKIDLKSFYSEFDLNGAFLIYKRNDKVFSVYNDFLVNVSITPASTFNIVTGLIALEDGICKNRNSILTKVHSGSPYSSNQNVTFQYAFRNNLDSFFWELRKRIGRDRMNYWLQKIHYGNLILPEKIDSTNGKDDFWVVNSDIRITPLQQLEFIEDLYYDKLPFTKTSCESIKEMMYLKNIKDFKIYGKRGSYRLTGEKKYIGWFVGFAERRPEVYFIVNYIETSNLSHPKIIDAQKQIVYNVLAKTALLK